MTQNPPSHGPSLGENGKAKAEERRRRQAEALRRNLHLRKAQDRSRDAAKPPEGEKTG